MTLSVDKLKQRLEEKFDLLVYFDVAEVSFHPGKLLQLLDPIYKNSYENNQRIVIFTSWEIPTELWKHLYQTINFLDISNWFVLICGPSSLEKSLLASCREFSHDPVPFQFMKVDLDSTQQIQSTYLLPDTICAIPWTNLEIRANGEITPCCSSESISLGNIKRTSLDQAFFSDKMENLREDFLKGLTPKECANCWKIESQGLTSIRMHNIKRLKKNLLLKYLDAPTLSTVDIKFNNTCNFKCRICGSESSSLFAQEQHQHLKVPLVVNEKWEESPAFLNQIIQHLPTIENIDMYGGEPFLIKKFSRVLEMAVSGGYAKKIRLHYNSNGSIWPKDFIPLWPHFQEVNIHFSIDDIGDRFELQRGGSWDTVESNIKNLQSLKMPNLNICVMPTISVMNVYYLDELYQWATDQNLDIFVNYVRSKKGFELDSLTKSAKDIIFEKYQNHPWQEIKNILEIIKNLPDSDGKSFCDTIRWFDQVRGQSFSQSHKEIAQAMGYVL